MSAEYVQSQSASRQSPSNGDMVRHNGHAVVERQPAPAYRPTASQAPEGVFQVIWHSRRFVLCAVLGSVVIAVAYMALATPLYYSGAKLYVEQHGPRIISTDSTQFLTDSKNYVNLQASLLKSMPVILGVLEKPGVGEMKTFAGVSDPVGYLKDQINVEVGRKDEIITVWLELPYPEETARLVNGLVDSYTHFNSAQKQSTGAEVLRILQEEKRVREEELARKVRVMLAFKQANPSLSFVDEKGNIQTQRLARLSSELTEAQVETMLAKAGFQVAQAALSDPDPTQRRDLVESLRAKDEMRGVDRDTEDLRKELARYETRLPIISTQYGDNHGVVRGAKAYIAELKSKLAAADGRIAETHLSTTRAAFEAVQRREDILRQSFEQQKQASLDLNTQEVEFARLQTDVRQVEKYCELLSDRIKELATVENAPALHIRVLESAQAAASPFKPAPARTLALAVAAGLLGGAGLSLARNNSDRRLRNPAQIARALDLRVLGTIPHISSRRDRLALSGADPLSEVAEAYRSLRTIVYHGIAPEQARTILVTSPNPGDGKSTLVCGLAMAMWQSGERVLVLDGDFRKPAMHRLFDLKTGVGVTNVLTDNVPIESAIVPSRFAGLDVLPCGTLPPNPAEILHSRAFAELLEQLTHRYHRILLDSPPANFLADARILGAMADLTLLVIRAGKTAKADAINALDVLNSVGARVFGAVTNDLRVEYGAYYDRRHNRPYRSGAAGATVAAVGDPSRLRFLKARVLPQEGQE